MKSLQVEFVKICFFFFFVSTKHYSTNPALVSREAINASTLNDFRQAAECHRQVFLLMIVIVCYCYCSCEHSQGAS